MLFQLGWHMFQCLGNVALDVFFSKFGLAFHDGNLEQTEKNEYYVSTIYLWAQIFVINVHNAFITHFLFASEVLAEVAIATIYLHAMTNFFPDCFTITSFVMFTY